MYKHIQWTKKEDKNNVSGHTTFTYSNFSKQTKVVSNQTLIFAHLYDTSRYTANTKMYSQILHTHRRVLIICRFEEMSF